MRIEPIDENFVEAFTKPGLICLLCLKNVGDLSLEEKIEHLRTHGLNYKVTAYATT